MATASNPMMGQATAGVPSNLSPSVIAQLQQDMMGMPLDQLQQYAQKHMDDPVYGSTIVSMASYVANMKKAAQVPTTIPNQPTVAQQAVQGIAPPQMPPAQIRPPQGPVQPALPEDQGIGQLAAQNIENLAKGGIAGYAGDDGSLVDDDQEDDDDDDMFAMQMLPRQQMQIPQGPGPADMPASISYESAPGTEAATVTKAAPGEYSSITERRSVGKVSSEGIKDLLKEAAEKTGAPEKLLTHIAQKETGGLKDRANAVSPAGALGLMQLMPRTAKELGVTDPFDTQQSALGAGRYVNQLLTKYGGDEKLAAMAYNWGPGNVDKWLRSGADPSRIPGETRQYVAGLAKGGMAHFNGDDGSDVSSAVADFGGLEGSPLAGLLIRPPTLDQQRAQAMKEAYANATPSYLQNAAPSSPRPVMANDPRLLGATPPMPQQMAPAQQSIVPQSTSDYDLGISQAMPAVSQQAVAAAPAAAAPAAPSALDDMRAYIKEHIENLKTQQQKNDAWALINMGAAIASGTSPHAFENIGKGVMAGSAMASENDKQLAAQQNALFGHQITLENAVANQDINKAKAAMYGAVRDAQLNQAKTTEENKNEARQGALALKEQQAQAAKYKVESDWMSRTEQNAINAHMAMLKGNQMFMLQNSSNPDALATQARLNAMKDLSNNPRYVSTYKKLNAGASPLDALPSVSFTGGPASTSGWGQAKISGS